MVYMITPFFDEAEIYVFLFNKFTLFSTQTNTQFCLVKPLLWAVQAFEEEFSVSLALILSPVPDPCMAPPWSTTRPLVIGRPVTVSTG